MNLTAALQAVTTALAAIPGIETASTDPARVTAPGVVVQLVSIERTTLQGRQLNLQLLLVAADVDGGLGAAAQLSTLLAAVETYAHADGPILARSILLPSNPNPLPGLVFPLTTYTAED